jgi:hypothetical protein
VTTNVQRLSMISNLGQRREAFVVFTPLAFLILWLEIRWPIRRALVVSVLVGPMADAVFDVLLTRSL